MGIFLSKIFNKLRVQQYLFAVIAFFTLFSIPANANWGIIDSLDLSGFIPIILDSLMAVATAGYDFFVGKGDGIIYILVWGWLATFIALYLVKMYFPKTWVGFFGFKGGGEAFEGNITGFQIGENLLKPAMRAIIAATILLQIKPIYVTDWVVDPFLRFGAIYTENIVSTVDPMVGRAKKMECPADIVEKGWISKDSCEFLVQPVAEITHANNQIIKRGFEFIESGLSGLIGVIPHGGEDFLNLITGILLVFAFVSSSFFMALLIIQGIFNFGMSLVLYPFKVLVYVIKPTNPDKWFDPWPAFDGIIKALKELVITMIASAFILTINIAIIRALFQWNTSVFVVAAHGSATSNVPTVANNASGFGQHSILWLSTILTFYLMFKIFELTKEKLNEYAGNNMNELHKSVTGDFKTTTTNARKFIKNVKDIIVKKEKK